VAIYGNGLDASTGYAFSSTPGQMRDIDVSERGKTLRFDSVITWSDYSSQRNQADKAIWSVDDTSIATVSSNGIVTPLANGSVTLRLRVDGAQTQSGSMLEARCRINFYGQQDGYYVQAISIIDEAGNIYDTATPYIIEVESEDDLGSIMLNFYALVTVHDPASGQTRTLDTREGSLSSQTAQMPTPIADLTWALDDGNFGSFLNGTGLYRPGTKTGAATIFATSFSGIKPGQPVRGSAALRISGPPQVEGYHPQDTLTIKVYYEQYPPSEYGEEAYTNTQVFDAGDLTGMGAFTALYTAAGSATTTYKGYGPTLRSVLTQGMGLDLTGGAGVSKLIFASYDNDWSVPYANLLGTSRYYFPYAGSNIWAGAQQVDAMLAINSSNWPANESDPGVMSEANRFHLLVGAFGLGDNNTSWQRKWIHTITVVMGGAPPVQMGDGDGGGDGSGTGTGDDSGSGTGTGDSGQGTDGQTGGEGAGDGASTSGSGSDAGAVGDAGPLVAIQATDPGAGQQTEGRLGGSSEATHGGIDATQPSTPDNQSQPAAGGYTVYQMMNANKSAIEQTLDFSGPWSQATLPAAGGLLALGGAQALLWYRRQTTLAPLTSLAKGATA
jgi:hypothetical protein